ncbi:hypothetical protein ACFX2G_002883 [Malus domestica]
MPPSPLKFDKNLPEGFYISRWQEPGRAETYFGCFDETVAQNIYILFSISEIPIAAKNQKIMDVVDPSTPIPPWFTEEDLAAYGALYEKSGFQTALQIPYRALREESGLINLIVKDPALYIMGSKDYVNKFPGIDYYIDIGRVKKFVPNLEIQYMSEGWHFVQEQSLARLISLSLPSLESTFDCYCMREDCRDEVLFIEGFCKASPVLAKKVKQTRPHSYNIFFRWAIQNMPQSIGADAGGLLLRVLELHLPAEECHRRNMYGGRRPWFDPDDMGLQDDNPKLCNASDPPNS